MQYNSSPPRYVIVNNNFPSPPENLMMQGSPTHNFSPYLGHVVIDPSQMIDPAEALPSPIMSTADSPIMYTLDREANTPPDAPRFKTLYRQGMDADNNVSVGEYMPVPPMIQRDTGDLPFVRAWNPSLERGTTLFRAATAEGFIDLKQPARTMPTRLVKSRRIKQPLRKAVEEAALAADAAMLMNVKTSPPRAGSVKRAGDDNTYVSGQPPHKRGLYGSFPRGILMSDHSGGKGWVILPPGTAMPQFAGGVKYPESDDE